MAWPGSGEPPPVADGHLLTVSSPGERDLLFHVLVYKGTNPLCEGSPLMISSPPKGPHLLIYHLRG